MVGKYTIKVRDNWGGTHEATIDIIEISEPRNIRGRTSEGNWAVDYTVPSTLGNTGFRVNTQYFWRKKEALEWIEQRKAQAVLV